METVKIVVPIPPQSVKVTAPAVPAIYVKISTGFGSGSGGGISEVTGTDNRVTVDNTDPLKPKINIAEEYDAAIDAALDGLAILLLDAIAGRELLSNKKSAFATANADDYLNTLGLQSYVQEQLSNTITDEGTWDASLNTYPALDSLGNPIKKGNQWQISVDGLGLTQPYSIIRALVDNPGQDPTKWFRENRSTPPAPPSVVLPAGRVAFGSATNTVASSADITWNDTTKVFTVVNTVANALCANIGGVTITANLNGFTTRQQMNVAGFNITNTGNTPSINAPGAPFRTSGNYYIFTAANGVVNFSGAHAYGFNIGSRTNRPASTEVITTHFEHTGVLTAATGALSAHRDFVISHPTLTFTGASVVSDAATFAVTNAPAAGANATITNSYAIWVQAGKVRIQDIASVSNSMVQVDNRGVLSASNEIIDQWLTAGAATALLENAANWTGSSYTGAVITGTFKGQMHYSATYLFLAVADNLFIRFARA